MRVQDVMTADPSTVLPTDSLRTARDRMTTAGCRRLPVVDEAGHYCGAISKTAVLSQLKGGQA